MFDKKSRVVAVDDQLYFYEKDIIKDNQIFYGDIIVEISADYFNSGLGFLLFTDTQSYERGYLIKLGTREISLYFYNGAINELLVTNSVILEPPLSNINLVFTKKAKMLTVTSLSSSAPLLKYELPGYIDKQSFGIYSNSGNYINRCHVQTKTPHFWDINMENTKGGRLSFDKNKFSLQSCVNPAEIQQQDIRLAAGTYYLHYNASEDSDIKAYIIDQNDKRTDDEIKNLLKENQFILPNDTNVLLKFKGKNGNVSNVQISQTPHYYYVPTTDESGTFVGSKLSVNISDIDRLEVEFVLLDPYQDFEDNFIVSNGIDIFTKRTLNLETSKLYKIIYYKINNNLDLYEDNKIISSFKLINFAYSLHLLKNINAIIPSMLIYYHDHVVNGVTSVANKTVPNQIGSPIIVVDESGEPLDLSSSFREITNDNYVYYIFTNFERECFFSNFFELRYFPSSAVDSVSIYGIPAVAQFDVTKIYKAYKENHRDISQCTSNYHLLDESSYEISDKSVIIDYVVASQYKAFIVEYLKADSYCVNFNYTTREYEVDITTKKHKILYEKLDKNEFISVTKNFKYCDAELSAKKYIIARREE